MVGRRFDSYKDFFLSFDKFGKEFKLQHKGGDTFNTYYGAGISIILNFYISIYIIDTFIPMMNHEISDSSFSTAHRNAKETAFDPFKVGLTFAVGLDEALD